MNPSQKYIHLIILKPIATPASHTSFHFPMYVSYMYVITDPPHLPCQPVTILLPPRIEGLPPRPQSGNTHTHTHHSAQAPLEGPKEGCKTIYSRQGRCIYGASDVRKGTKTFRNAAENTCRAADGHVVLNGWSGLWGGEGEGRHADGCMCAWCEWE